MHDVVAAQRAAGTDIVNEGELTKGGNWVTFINSRLSGFEACRPEGTIALMHSSKDWHDFDDFYAKALAGGTLFEQTASAPAQTSAHPRLGVPRADSLHGPGRAAARDRLAKSVARVARPSPTRF